MLDGTGIGDILSSTGIIAATIAVFMILLIMYMWPVRNASTTVILKMFTYMFLVSGALIFLHDGVRKRSYDANHSDMATRSVMDAVNGGVDAAYIGSQNLIDPNTTVSAPLVHVSAEDLAELQEDISKPPSTANNPYQI